MKKKLSVIIICDHEYPIVEHDIKTIMDICDDEGKPLVDVCTAVNVSAYDKRTRQKIWNGEYPWQCDAHILKLDPHRKIEQHLFVERFPTREQNIPYVLFGDINAVRQFLMDVKFSLIARKSLQN